MGGRVEELFRKLSVKFFKNNNLYQLFVGRSWFAGFFGRAGAAQGYLVKLVGFIAQKQKIASFGRS